MDTPEDLAPYLEGFTIEEMLKVTPIVEAAMREACGTAYDEDVELVDLGTESSLSLMVSPELEQYALRAHNIGRKAMGLTLEVPDSDTAHRIIMFVNMRGW